MAAPANQSPLPVLAGVDGSELSIAAAHQAAATAAARGAPLLLVHGYLHPRGYGAAPLAPYVSFPPTPPAEGEAMLEQVSDALRRAHPGLSVTHKQQLGGGAPSLIEESRHAQLLVVGSRGHGGFAGLLLGSVSAHVVAHAHCPVLVIRPADPPEPPPDAPVMVGVDGSPGSTAALEYAADEATRRGAPLLVLCADAKEGGEPPEPLLAEAVHEARMLHPELTVDGRVEPGIGPAAALVEASREARLMVVGSRGRGGFVGLLLGSVSRALVHHAHCPVLVIPPRSRENLG